MAGPNPNYYPRSGLLDFLTSDTSDDLTYRSSMLPIGTYRGSDGRERAGLAWPQLALDAVDAIEAPGELLFGEGLDRDESQRRASIAAGLMMGGGLAAPRPGNALVKPAAQVSLPPRPVVTQDGAATTSNNLFMDQASRMARAREMGFDTDTPLYHGTHRDFDEFRASENGKFGAGVYFSPDRKEAYDWMYADVGEGRVIDAYARGKLAGDEDWERAVNAAYQANKSNPSSLDLEIAAGQLLKNEGFSGLNSQRMGETVIFDPRNIRSVNAAFDPAKSDSANLLFSNGSKGGAGVGIAEAAANALPMDQVSRMARANDQGYTLDAWHGTGKSNLTEFRPGTFFATDPKVASGFAANYEPTTRSYEMPAKRNGLQKLYDKVTGNNPVQTVTIPDLKRTQDGASVYPVKINPDGFETLDWRQASGSANYDLGVDKFFANNPNAPGVIVKNVLEAEMGLEKFLHDQIIVRDPSRIRSVNAAFDPAQADSANLLAANASPSTGLMSLYGYDDEYDPFLNY